MAMLVITRLSRSNVSDGSDGFRSSKKLGEDWWNTYDEIAVAAQDPKGGHRTVVGASVFWASRRVG